MKMLAMTQSVGEDLCSKSRLPGAPNMSGQFDDLCDRQGPFTTVLRQLQEHKEHHQ